MSRALNDATTALLIVDVQDAFRKSIPDFDALIQRAKTVARGFEILRRPILITEQYPKGLGPTVSELKEEITSAAYFEKSEFSACAAIGFESHLKELAVEAVVIAGIETHVCVNQTVNGLLEAGYNVHLLEDAVSSRKVMDREVALRKMYQSGAIPSTVEMALFELLVDSNSPDFKAIQALIR